MNTSALFLTFLCVAIGSLIPAYGASYHVDSKLGADGNDGLSPKTAWQTLEKASTRTYRGGDRILLKRGCAFKGKLTLNQAMGRKDTPVLIDAYGAGESLPKIDSAGYIAGVALVGSKHIEVRNLEITSDGGKEIDKLAKTDRYGVHVSHSSSVWIDSLSIHEIFATIQTKSEGKDKTTAYGHGVRIEDSDGVYVGDCSIERVGRYGINARKSADIKVLNNNTDHTGCSGIQMSRCTNAVIQGNTFDHPGSFIDERMHGRGSGSWVWGCENVLYDGNTFMNAKGKGDSCGVHIDFNCKNIVVQYCLSRNNEGGFIEILGNNHNCAYRYNISVNDGFRKKGKGGAHQEGKVFWLSGYCGSKKPPYGPFNSYIYNNTIYVKEGARSCFSISPTSRGALVANNIFHLLGPTVDVLGDQTKRRKAQSEAERIVFNNNLYIHDAILPKSLKIQDKNSIIGDAGFKNPGGISPEDYIPTNAGLVKDKGIAITKLPKDDIGLTMGLPVEKDFLGNPIVNAPDMGAIEIRD